MRSVVYSICTQAILVLAFISPVVGLHSEGVRFDGPATVREGDTVEISWEIHNATYVTIDNVVGRLPASSSLKVAPLVTTTYVLHAYLPGDSLKATHTVSVLPPPSLDQLKQKFMVERAQERAQYLAGTISLDSVIMGEKFYYDIIGYDRTGYPDKVTLFVTVQDRYGNFISGLAHPKGSDSSAYRFFRSLSETMDSKHVEVKDFSVHEVHDSVSQPHAFSLVLDYSGSMTDHIHDLETSALQFIADKDDSDEIAVVKFASFVSREVPLGRSRDRLLQQFKQTGLTDLLGDRTALYAGADEGIKAMDSATGKRTLVLFTDGRDNASISRAVDGGYSFTPRELIIKALKTNTSVYTIGFADADSTFLASMAMLTGGRYFYARSGNEIAAIYSSLPRMFRNRYELSFRPMLGDGLRTIEMTANNHKDSVVSRGTTMYLGRPDNLPHLPTMTSEAQSVAHFDSGKAVADVDRALISKIADYLRANPIAKVVIRGHTDLRGNAAKNKILGRQRAESVAAVLVKHGVRQQRIQTMGIGQEEPLWSPDNEEWQAHENRRVDIIVQN